MPLVFSKSHLAALGSVVAATGAALLSASGQGHAGLALLCGLGAACAILAITGQLRVGNNGSELDAGILSVLRASPAALAVSNRKGVIIWKSASFANAVGKSTQDDLSRLGRGGASEAAAVYRLFDRARSGMPHSEALTPPENVERVLVKVSPFGEVGKAVSHFVWQIEAAGAPSAETARFFSLESLPLPALFVGDGMRVEAANPSFEKFAGFSPIGREVSTVIRMGEGAITRARLKEIVAKAKASIPVHICAAGGIVRAANLHFAALGDGASGNAAPILWIIVPGAPVPDSLKDSFHALLAHSPTPTAIIGPKAMICETNDAFQRLFANESGEAGAASQLIGRPLPSLFARPSAQYVSEKVAGLLGSGNRAGPPEVDCELRKGASKRIRLQFFRTGDERSLMVCATEREESAHLNERAAQNQKLQAVGELAGGIAHDFNNLLTAIIGFSDLLLRRFRASDPVFKDLMNIKNNATRAAELVKQILAYSSRQTLRPALLKLTDVIEEFQATMGRTLGEKVKASVQHGRDLWFVKADEGQLFQVIMNLAVNARDAMQNGGEIVIRTANCTERESLTIKDRGLDRGEYVMCEVRDTGTGIKAEHLEKIFDPYFSTKEVGKGTGLGLSTVYGIVKQTGGTIIVDSEIGKGTSFRIYLPRYHETEDDLKALENKPIGAEKLLDLTGQGTVLLVEDEEAVRSFASRALATRGYTVLEAESGAEALDIMDREQGRIDLVVSDVVMPEMDGPTLLRHLRQRNPSIRIVFMSGYAEEAFRKNLSEDEDFIFLPKPFTLKRLAETVKAATAG